MLDRTTTHSPSLDEAQIETDVCNAIRDYAGQLPQVDIAYEPAIKALWVTTKPEPKPVFTPTLVSSLTRVQDALTHLYGGDKARHAPVRYMICRSEGPVCTLGGDLDFYLDCIAKGDRAALQAYADGTVAGAIWNASGGHGCFITLAMIHARAIGGGIDAARSCQVMVAESHATFSYPEVKFNHFPITAVPVLTRRMGRLEAERVLLTGDEFTAEEFRQRGGLEAVVPQGESEAWIRKYCAETLPVHAARSSLNTLFYRDMRSFEEDLRVSAAMWVDCMLKMSPMEIAKLQRIAQMQERMLARMY